jgi:hypothetical protein
MAYCRRYGPKSTMAYCRQYGPKSTTAYRRQYGSKSTTAYRSQYRPRSIAACRSRCCTLPRIRIVCSDVRYATNKHTVSTLNYYTRDGVAAKLADQGVEGVSRGCSSPIDLTRDLSAAQRSLFETIGF